MSKVDGDIDPCGHSGIQASGMSLYLYQVASLSELKMAATLLLLPVQGRRKKYKYEPKFIHIISTQIPLSKTYLEL